jgi:hypothetical protein
LERLSANNTIETVGCESRITTQVGNDSGLWVSFFDVKYIGAAHPLLAELFGVAIISHLKDSSPNIRQVFRQEPFYVVAIDTVAPVETKFFADGGKPP